MIRTRVVFPLIWLRVSLINGIVECAQGVSLQCIPIDPNQSFIAEVNQNILRYPKNILKCAQGISLQYISMEPKQSFTRQWSEQKYLRDHLRVIKKTFGGPIEITQMVQTWWLSDNILPIDKETQLIMFCLSRLPFGPLDQDARGIQGHTITRANMMWYNLPSVLDQYQEWMKSIVPNP